MIFYDYNVKILNLSFGKMVGRDYDAEVHCHVLGLAFAQILWINFASLLASALSLLRKRQAGHLIAITDADQCTY